jgi:subtilisin family serine protease
MARKTQLRLMVCVLVSVLLMGGVVFAQSAKDGRRIVTFQGIDLNTTLGYTTALSVVTASLSSQVHKLSFINAIAIQLPLDDITGALALLLSSPYVLEVSDDPLGSVGRIAPTLAPLVEDLDWGLKRIGIADAHQRWPELKGKGVKVAVLDTGIDTNHPELYKNISDGYNALPGGKSLKDNHGHGTYMAGIIIATLNGQGIKGAAPQATLVPVKVLDQNGIGHLSDFLNGLQWVYSTNIPLANMSIQFKENYRPLEEATTRLYKRGVMMVAAAGNRCSAGPPDEGGDGGDAECDTTTVYDPSQIEVAYPARYPWVISVAAIDYYNRVTDYSRSGKVDIAAPGGSEATGIRILSTNTGGGYGLGSGTSHAAAHVTGTCALALQRYPGLSFEQALELLQRTATDLGYPRERQGAGLTDAVKLMEAL